jgi:nondiscriminating aspartyl-tRNA synthetase
MSETQITTQTPGVRRTWVGDVPHSVGLTIRVSGLVETIRDQKRMQFLVLRDRTGAVQLTHEKATDDEIAERISALTPGSAISAIGRVVAAEQVKLGGIELVLEAIEIASIADSPLPIAPDSALEKQIDWRQIGLRRPEEFLTFAVQTTLERAMREFWRQEGFVEIHLPKLMGTFSESGAEAFKVEYFSDRSAYLAQSPQFYKQMAMAAGFERVFEIGPAFRAEPSFTTRHETEFTSIDMELSWIDSHEDVMQMEERWLAHSLAVVAAEHGADIDRLFGVEISVPEVPFPRVTFAEAQAIVRQAGVPLPKEDDLGPEAERALSTYSAAQYGHEFTFVTDYPSSGRAFYHMRHEDRAGTTKGFDLLWKGLEITTGAQREHRYDRLVQQAVERGYALGPLRSYLEFFRYGCPPHGGAGIGLGRVLMILLGRQSIREVTLVSRTPTRLHP